MTFRCMPAFQTLGGGADCGASWVSALHLCKTHVICRNRSQMRGSQMRTRARARALDDLSSADSWNTWRHRYYSLLSTLLTSSYPSSFSLCVSSRYPTLNVERTPINARDTKDICIDNICEHSYFYSINSLSSFSKRCYRLDAYWALVILSRFSAEMRNGDIFTRPTVPRVSVIRTSLFLPVPVPFSLLAHRNFFNYTENVNYLITSKRLE